MIKKEKWKKVKGFEDFYKVSDHGHIKRLHGKANSFDKRMVNEKILTASINKGGKFYTVQFFINGKRILKLPHRLVAEHFIKNPKKHQCVNFKDGDVSNFNVDNLEWCDRGELIKKVRSSKI